MVVVVPSSEKAAGLRTPLELSAPTALPMATGSKNASCSVPSGAVTVSVTVRRFVANDQSLPHPSVRDDSPFG